MINVNAVSRDKCPLITCSEPESNTGTCFKSTLNEFGILNKSFTKCSEGRYCIGAAEYHKPKEPEDIKAEEITCSTIPDNDDYIDMAKFCKGQLPGSPCNFPEHCKNNLCEKNVCVAALEGGNCLSNVNCSVGLYCNKLKCEKLRTIGESCENDFACMNDQFCLNSVCKQMYTQAVGTVVKDARDCNFGKTTTNDNEELVCDALVLEKEQCGEGEDKCTYRWFIAGIEEERECMCDPTMKTQDRKCPSLIEEGRPYIYTELHTDNRYNGVCDQVGKAYKKNACVGLTIYGEDGWAEIGSGYLIKSVWSVLLLMLLI
jgi:hypothetical protein